MTDRLKSAVEYVEDAVAKGTPLPDLVCQVQQETIEACAKHVEDCGYGGYGTNKIQHTVCYSSCHQLDAERIRQLKGKL